MMPARSNTFDCLSCGSPCHEDYLEYDIYGAGCPHCGYHFSFLVIKELVEGTALRYAREVSHD